ncbi:Histidine kinase-, DNA gyrase B-, and HSP90-like ATPase [Desulfacinum hydrothermale DSM 13146]|uniref:histidine kinase n=1 Tax=Desulfacinum hydrothermale DSM 13146 TaxID=1121390 RepID=A0A1W1X699_9BACT|nr:HAMP domain-containing sensor histidine kinase [Desulfacinum hydrothermale]SMC19455.1 Histidine kinase-, DNA gyrase B-, and HSP90-like ATPase [Desulfacinum hydrothermale DSM 13146]
MHGDLDMKKCFAALAELDRPGHMGRLMRGLIHNINGPLQNISMLLELMERNHTRMEDLVASLSDQDGSDLPRLLDSEKGRLGRLLEQVRLFSDMLRDFMILHEIEANESEIDVNQILERLGKIYKADLFFKHHVSLRLELAPHVPLLRVLGRHLVPALHHLIQNGLTALRAASEKELVLATDVFQDEVWIRVEDNGCGLSDQVPTEELFTPFATHWPSEVNEQEKGRNHLGLGLALAQHLLSPYGAQVRLEPMETGTRAVVILPVPGTFCRTKG